MVKEKLCLGQDVYSYKLRERDDKTREGDEEVQQRGVILISQWIVTPHLALFHRLPGSST